MGRMSSDAYEHLYCVFVPSSTNYHNDAVVRLNSGYLGNIR
jgi:hypothetical protein